MADSVVNLQLSVPSLAGQLLWLYPDGGGTLLNAGGDALSVVGGDASGLNYQATVAEADGVDGTVQGHVGPDASTVIAGPFAITIVNGDAGPFEPDDPVTAALESYDPPTRTEATADKDEILTRGSTGPWTTGAGVGGGDATEAKQDQILVAIAALDAGTGAGAFQIDLTLKRDDLSLLGECDIIVTTSTTGPTTDVYANARTDVNGAVTFFCDAGTYYLWRQKAGENFTDNPKTMSVDGGGVATIS